jgi:hypothetical protein
MQFGAREIILENAEIMEFASKCIIKEQLNILY